MYNNKLPHFPKGPKKNGNQRNDNFRGNSPAPARSQASPDVIGSPFHNPYTFLPFPDHAPQINEPTPLTREECASGYLTGIVRAKLKNISPLMTLSQDGGEKNGTNKALTIGDDVIVPATSVRGSLRTLMSIISGGTLGFLDKDLFLCQGRDAQPANGPQLALVLKAGSSQRDGVVQLGETRLVETQKLENLFRNNGKDLLEARGKRSATFWIDNPDNPQLLRTGGQSKDCPWCLKLSGKKVGKRGKAHDGAFLPNGSELTIPASFWAEYEGRNRNSDFPKLEDWDIIWLFGKQKEKVNEISQLDSIQWARWGRKGVSLKKMIASYLWPNSCREDHKVDAVGDLFGEVFDDGAPAFAARIRPENLVFKDEAENLLCDVELAPLMTPHPGCGAFYREMSTGTPKGYKIYRTSQEQGKDAPWHYCTQPIYDRGRKKSFDGEKCKKVDLLPSGKSGELQISFRSVTRKELALLLLALSCDLRFGGGKPFGLGHTVVERVDVISETGDYLLQNYQFSRRAEIPPAFADDLKDEQILKRADKYCKTQIPVPKLRYPRFVDNRNGNVNRGGMCWFARFAAPQKNGKGGVQVVHTDGELAVKTSGKDIRGQYLPKFDPENPQSDLLYGYDLAAVGEKKGDGWHMSRFYDGSSLTDQNPSYREDNHSSNRDSRQREKKDR